MPAAVAVGRFRTLALLAPARVGAASIRNSCSSATRSVDNSLGWESSCTSDFRLRGVLPKTDLTGSLPGGSTSRRGLFVHRRLWDRQLAYDWYPLGCTSGEDARHEKD